MEIIILGLNLTSLLMKFLTVGNPSGLWGCSLIVGKIKQMLQIEELVLQDWVEEFK